VYALSFLDAAISRVFTIFASDSDAYLLLMMNGEYWIKANSFGDLVLMLFIEEGRWC
jgi:hypothetical protein